MKTYNYLGILLLFAILISCKKSPDDPLLSFRSRTNKLEGKWLLTDWEGKTVEQLSWITFTETFNWDGLKYSWKISAQEVLGYNEQIDGTLYYEMTINKDGTMSDSFQRVSNNSNDPISAYANAGYWMWADGVKKKNNLVLEAFSPFVGLTNENMFQILELRNNKLVLAKTYQNTENIYYVLGISGDHKFTFTKVK